MTKKLLPDLNGKKFSIFLASPFFLYTITAKERVAIISGSSDLKEKSPGSETFCMAKGLSDRFKGQQTKGFPC